MKTKNKFLEKTLNRIAQKTKLKRFSKQFSTGKTKNFPLFLPLLFFCSSCLVNLSGQDIPIYLPSIGGGPSISNSDYFYVDLNTEAYDDENRPLYEINTTEEYNSAEERDSRSNCEIEYEPVDDDEEPLSSRTIICIMDIPEWEFVTNSLNLVVNVPGGMCKNVRITLPWHFNHELLAGPVSKECEPPGEDSGQGYCDSRPGSYAACDDNRCLEEEDDLCPGRGRTNNVGGVQCCSEGRKLDGGTWEPDEECFGGPAVISNEFDEFPPRRTVTLPENGLRQTITLPDLVSINNAQGISIGEFPPAYQTTSFPFANYLKILDKPAEDIADVDMSDLPNFLKRSDFYNYTPQPFFEFQCYGQAGEILHEILLMIREWNTMEEFLNFYDSGGDDESDPDVEGEEGDECPYEERETGGYGKCNDLLDLDDCSAGAVGAWCYGGYPRMNYSESSTEE